MDSQRVEEIFKESGVLQEGHFVLTSGRHSDKYMQCAMLMQDPKHSEMLCKELAAAFCDMDIDVVVAPAVGAIIFGYEIARALGVRFIFAEREGGKMTLRRGFKLEQGEKALVVEDVTTTGGTVYEIIDLVRSLGGVVQGAGLLVDRSGGTLDFGVRHKALLSVPIESWSPEDCPLCKAGLPFTKPGSRDLKLG
jgi:orotate phosphoribosyltransferase